MKRTATLLLATCTLLVAGTAQPGIGDRGPDQGGGATTPANSAAPDTEPASERWNLFSQATSIGQYHGSFRSPYSGQFSLQGHPEAEASLTTTLFFGLRLAPNTERKSTRQNSSHRCISYAAL